MKTITGLKLLYLVLFLLFPLICRPGEVYNSGNPLTEEYYLTNLLRCLLQDQWCPVDMIPTPPQIICAAGYIVVPANPAVGTTGDFCVAKYEMKNNGGAKSEAAGNPWVNLDQPAAITQCAGIGTGYHLITNPEWMTIARNIETTGSNWSSGTVYSGNLARGWAANTSVTPVDAWQNTAVATSTDVSCLYNTAADTCGATGTHLYRRTHTLSNGEEIWDFSGNVAEWNDWNVLTGKASAQNAWLEINTEAVPNATMPAESFQSTNNTLTAITHAIGRYYPALDGAGGATIRGGDRAAGADAGIFELNLGNNPTSAFVSVGFRCVYSQ